LRNVNSELARSVKDGVVVAINSIRLLPSGAEMVVSASRKSQILLKTHKLQIVRTGNRNLPILRDVATGKIVEQMKEVKAAKAIARLCAASTAIIGAAHLISGADIAKRLQVMDKKINLLLPNCRPANGTAQIARPSA
jgi:hypothetical protein